MIAFASFLTIAAAISWHPRLYPDTPHGLYFGEGFFAGLTAAASAAWIAAIAIAFHG